MGIRSRGWTDSGLHMKGAQVVPLRGKGCQRTGPRDLENLSGAWKMRSCKRGYAPTVNMIGDAGAGRKHATMIGDRTPPITVTRKGVANYRSSEHKVLMSFAAKLRLWTWKVVIWSLHVHTSRIKPLLRCGIAPGLQWLDNTMKRHFRACDAAFGLDLSHSALLTRPVPLLARMMAIGPSPESRDRRRTSLA